MDWAAQWNAAEVRATAHSTVLFKARQFIVVLTGATLLVRSFVALLSEDPGFGSALDGSGRTCNGS